MQRRSFLKWSLYAGALTTLGLAGFSCSRDPEMADQPFQLPRLPYDLDALEPYLSEKTLKYHYGQHHRGYVGNANRLVSDTSLSKHTLTDVIRKSFQPKASAQNKIFNNTAQVYNHTIYWNSLTPAGGGAPDGLMAEWIDKSFGSYRAFRKIFSTKAHDHFASGWIWLVLNGGKLEVISTTNAETPIVYGMQPLLVLDVWEHAYYLDYQNQRDQYVQAFLDHLINWPFAVNNIGEI
jgi:Fe-Mn family superoxide dismutase